MQATLKLNGGYDLGPLFSPPRKRRASKPKARGWDYYHRRHIEKTPGWADHDATAAMHDAARLLTEQTGVLYEVDHIVPLNHPLVCGLHWHGNMQVMTGDGNRQKANNWWPDMPGEQMALI